MAHIGGKPLIGEIVDVQVPPPLKERLKTIKDLPLTQQEIENLASEGDFGGKKLQFSCNLSTPFIIDAGKSKTKNNSFLMTSLMEADGKTLKQCQPEKGTKLNVFIYDMAGKAVMKKKDKWEANMPQIQCDIPNGCYLVVAWTELKNQKLGKFFYASLDKRY